MILKQLLAILEADEPKKKKKSEEDKKKEKDFKDKEDDKPDLSAYNRTKKDEPLAHRKDDKKPDEKKSDEKAPRTVGKDATSRASRNISMDDESTNHLANLHRNMPDDDESVDANPDTTSTDLVPRKPSDVPAMISDAMVAAGFVDPDFHLVANLPGNMSSAIRRLGKALFGSLTKTPTDQVSMVGNLGGMGPNSRVEVNSVASYIKKHGDDYGPGEIDFDAVMPGYKAKIHNFVANGTHFMMVKDQMGDYIYAWPEKDTKAGSGTGSLEHKKADPKRLN